MRAPASAMRAPASMNRAHLEQSCCGCPKHGACSFGTHACTVFLCSRSVLSESSCAVRYTWCAIEHALCSTEHDMGSASRHAPLSTHSAGLSMHRAPLRTICAQLRLSVIILPWARIVFQRSTHHAAQRLPTIGLGGARFGSL